MGQEALVRQTDRRGDQDAQYARLAAMVCADALIVSNHGGRPMDGVPSSIAAMPAAVDAVRGQIEVHMDGGVRSGLDVLRAFALGAKGVYIGRPFRYGFGAMGEAGVMRCLALIRNELDLTMAFCGRTHVTQIGPDILFYRGVDQ